MKTSKKGIELIKSFEGFSAVQYRCAGNKLTIGYGTVIEDRPWINNIDKEYAEELMAQDLIEFENAVNELVTVPINQNQFDALVSFVYNVGISAFKNSTILRKINMLDHHAAQEMLRWCYAGGKYVKGLEKRRSEEKKLFDTPI